MRSALLPIPALALALAGCATPGTEPAPLLANGLANGATARGSVFHDRDADGLRDAGEAGIPGVAVSDGRSVTRTDSAGRWTLPRHDDAIYFVIKPRGWMTPVDALNLPRFYYLHKPMGSPPLRQGGVAPTGPLPGSIDFPLVPRAESDVFDVVVLGDPQPYSLEEVDYFSQDVLMELVGVDALFGVSLGDLVGDDASLFEPLNRAVSLVGIPWYNVLGNHDLDYDAPDDATSDESFERVYGPATYAFQVASVHFLVLDDVRFLGRPTSEERPLIYEGGLDERTLDFVEAYLREVPRDELVVALMHIPLVGTPMHEVRLDERRRFFEILASHPRSFSLSAHTHIQQHWFLGAEHGNPGPVHHHLNHGTAAGSWWRGAPDESGIPHATMRCGAPNGHSILSFEGDRYRVRFKAARRPIDHQMNLFAPAAVSATAAPGTEVLANVFAGSERSQVEMRVAGGPWIEMERVEREDPTYMATRGRERAAGIGQLRPSPEPVRSPHLWRAWLPAGLERGAALIEVRSRDVFGQLHSGRRSIRID